MIAKEIKVGNLYTACVDGNTVVVLVTAIRRAKCLNTGRSVNEYTVRKVYDVQNLTTGGQTTFKSAANFLTDVTNEPDIPRPISPC